MQKEIVFPEYKLSLGRPLKYNPANLEKKFVEYIEWCEANPVPVAAEKTSSSEFGPRTTSEVVLKPRVISVTGFLIFLGESWCWWEQLDGSKTDFSKVKSRIHEYCKDFQVGMAYCGVYKENIVARNLGLAEKSENKHEVSASEDTVRKVEAALLKLSDKEFDSVLSIVNKEDK